MTPCRHADIVSECSQDTSSFTETVQEPKFAFAVDWIKGLVEKEEFHPSTIAKQQMLDSVTLLDIGLHLYDSHYMDCMDSHHS